jgi:hypothetical protein
VPCDSEDRRLQLWCGSSRALTGNKADDHKLKMVLHYGASLIFDPKLGRQYPRDKARNVRLCCPVHFSSSIPFNLAPYGTVPNLINLVFCLLVARDDGAAVLAAQTSLPTFNGHSYQRRPRMPGRQPRMQCAGLYLR